MKELLLLLIQIYEYAIQRLFVPYLNDFNKLKNTLFRQRKTDSYGS